jgi:hypothetical protein
VIALGWLLAVAIVGGLVGWVWWGNHVRYGPICDGNARWRREAPRREAEEERRNTLAALTMQDRAWLKSMGWQPTGQLPTWFTKATP